MQKFENDRRMARIMEAVAVIFLLLVMGGMFVKFLFF